MHLVDAKGILSAQNGMNLYRGCVHGCIYCDSRSRCYRIDHPFEDVEVKRNALELLDAALRKKRRRGMLSTGAMTDPYIPEEEIFGLTRGAMRLALRHGFGFTLQTKSTRVLRDLPLLQELNARTRCVVQMTLTTADEALCRKIEPNVSATLERARALQTLADAGVPTVAWLTPILPFINDTPENLLSVLRLLKGAGVRGVIFFGAGLTLREGSREYFYAQLDRLFPGLKERYARTYGLRYEIPSPDNDRLCRLFHDFCESNNLMHDNDQIFACLHAFPDPPSDQLSLFD